MNQPMVVVRFVTDYTPYAAGEEAAFSEGAAMKLTQLGRATILGTVAEIAGPLRIPQAQEREVEALLEVADAAVDAAEAVAKRGPGRPRKTEVM